ncbi:MAG: hypothetical protein SGPRY_011845 [Prymnesium sp.]
MEGQGPRGRAAPPSSSGEGGGAQYASGDRLLLAPPSSSGLPNGATAIVKSARYDDALACWVYDLTLTGGGKHGSDIRFVSSVREGWLRTEGRIATAKNCAPIPFAQFMRSAARVLVPLFQRRYCWGEKEWDQMWESVSAPRVNGSSSLGRVVVCREGEALVIVDGQQRCTTMLLLICALRDVVQQIHVELKTSPMPSPAPPELGSLSSDLPSLLKKLESILRTRLRTTTKRRLALGEEQYGVEALSDAWSVRFLPSREDSLSFCSLVLAKPFDTEGSAAARKMYSCYSAFHHKIDKLVAGDEGCEFAVKPGQSDTSSALRLLRLRVNGLLQLATNALDRTQLLCFELQDGVAVQNMYDMLAQREKAVNSLFANVGGKPMSEADLVRNLILNHIADEQCRTDAYDEYWIAIERAHGDGDTAKLEAFLRAFLTSQKSRGHILPSILPEPETSEVESGERGTEDTMQFDRLLLRDAPESTHASADDKAFFEGFATLLKTRGGNSGTASLYAAGAEAAGVEVVDEESTMRAAISVLKEMRQFSMTYESTSLESSHT